MFNDILISVELSERALTETQSVHGLTAGVYSGRQRRQFCDSYRCRNEVKYQVAFIIQLIIQSVV